MTAPLSPSQSDTGAVDAENPWPGLASFREADRELFYGRERETEELFRLVLRERLTVLFGLSGLGKTSLLQAGVFPRLRDENVLPVPIRLDHSDGAAPFPEQIAAAIARACAAAGAEAPAPRPGETLWEHFHRQGNDFWSARNRPLVPLLAFDQFEEIFTLGRGRPATAGLVETLTSLAEGHPPAAVKARLDANPAEAKDFSFARHNYKILLSLREDFLPDLDALRKSIRTIGNNRLRLCRMTGENALRVVLLPGRDLLDADVAERAVRFVAGEEPGEEPAPLPELEIEPALLSIVCRELNNKRRARGEACITADLLEGHRTAILTDLYERSLDGLPPEVRTFIEERLLTVSGFRDSVALENALATPGVTREAVDRLTERRLLRIEDHGGGQRIELTHDVLTGVVRASRDSRRQREAEAQAEIARREAEVRERKVRRELRRSRQVLILVGVLLAAVAAFSVYAHLAQMKIRQTLADSDVLRALNLEEERPQEALACLGHALSLDPDNLAARSLLFDLLLNRSWLLPFQGTLIPDAVTTALGPEDRTAAVLDVQGAVRIYDMGSLRPTGVVLRGAMPFEDLRYSPDGRRIATFTESAMRLWDVATGAPAGGPFSREGVSLYGLGPDFRRVLAVRGDTARFLDAATGAEAGPAVPAASLETRESHDGEHVLRVERSGAGWSILVHDIGTGKAVGTPLTSAVPVRAPQISPDGSLIAAVVEGGVQIWDGVTHRPLALLDHEAPVGRMKLGPSDRLLITNSEDGFARAWAPRSGRLLARVELDSAVRTFELSSGTGSGRLLATVTEDRTARLWDAATGRLMAEPVPDVAAANLLTGGALRLATASEDGFIRVLTPTAPAETRVATASGPPFDAVGIAPDGRRFAVVDAGTLTVRETTTGRQVGPALPGLAGALSVRFLADGRQVAVIRRGEALTWDVEAGRIAGRVPLGAWFATTSVSPDGTKVAAVESADLPEVVRVFDMATGKALTGPLRYQGAASWGPVPFSPDGGRLLTSSGDQVAEVVDLATGKAVVTLRHRGRILQASFSPDGSKVLTVADDRTARLWDATSGQHLQSFKSAHGLASAMLAAGGSRLLTISEDTRVRLWDTATGKAIGQRILTPATTVQLAPDGFRILILTDDGARLSDTATGHAMSNPMIPGGHHLTARFLAGRPSLVLATDRAVGVWDLPTGGTGDAELLVRWAEAVGGYRLDPKGGALPVANLPRKLEDLRRETAAAPLGQDTVPSLIRWFFTAPGKRPKSPLAR